MNGTYYQLIVHVLVVLICLNIIIYIDMLDSR